MNATKVWQKLLSSREWNVKNSDWIVRIDVLKVDTTKLINSVKLESNDTGMIEGYKESIQLNRILICVTQLPL